MMGMDWESIFGDGVDLNDAWRSAVAAAPDHTQTDTALQSASEYKPRSLMIGIINGTKVAVKNNWAGHTFTPEEEKRLFNGEEIDFEYIDKHKNTRLVKGKLMKSSVYYGKMTWCFLPDYCYDRVKGRYDGKYISIKKSWSGHEFTEDELVRLFAGDEIEIDFIDKKGKPRKAKGSLAQREYGGHNIWGFTPDFQVAAKKK